LLALDSTHIPRARRAAITIISPLLKEFSNPTVSQPPPATTARSLLGMAGRFPVVLKCPYMPFVFLPGCVEQQYIDLSPHFEQVWAQSP